MAFDDTGLSDADARTREVELGKDAAELVRELDEAIGRVDPKLPVPELLRSPALEKVRKLSARIVEILDKPSPQK